MLLRVREASEEQSGKPRGRPRPHPGGAGESAGCWGARHAVLAAVGEDVRTSDVNSRRGGHRVKGEKTASLSFVSSRRLAGRGHSRRSGKVPCGVGRQQ